MHEAVHDTVPATLGLLNISGILVFDQMIPFDSGTPILVVAVPLKQLVTLYCTVQYIACHTTQYGMQRAVDCSILPTTLHCTACSVQCTMQYIANHSVHYSLQCSAGGAAHSAARGLR